MHRIKRTGKPALTFEGEEVASSGGKIAAGKEQNRWHDITLYRTTGGQYVVHVAYRTKWEGELEKDTAEVCNLDRVADFLAAYDPAGDVAGFPSAPQYADRQAHLLQWVRARFADQVGQILAACQDLDVKVD